MYFSQVLPENGEDCLNKALTCILFAFFLAVVDVGVADFLELERDVFSGGGARGGLAAEVDASPSG